MATDPDSPSTAEWHYWESTFTKQAEMIVHGVVPQTYYLAGDHAVATHPAEHFALAHNARAIMGGGGGGRGGGGKGADAWGSGGGGGGKPIEPGMYGKVQGGGGKPTDAGKGKQEVVPLVYKHNQKKKLLCTGFQDGTCKSKWLTKENRWDSVCPGSKEKRRQCNLCLSPDHMPSRCDAAGVSKKRKFKGGKNGGY